MIKFTWKRLCNVRKNDIEKVKTNVQTELSAKRGTEVRPSSLPSWSMPTVSTSCPGLFSMLEAIPLYGSPVSLLWPFGGLSLGAVANLCFKAGFSTEQQHRIKSRLLRVGGPAVMGMTGVYLASSIRRVPETGRLRFTAKWPWMNENSIADLEPVFENFLESRVAKEFEGKPRWASSVFYKLKNGNGDIPFMASEPWKIKVIDESLAMLLCFVVPRSHNIWMSSYYLRLVEDDPQLAYVLGHELSHVICRHGRDFCFVEFVREALLLTTGTMMGWYLTDGAKPETSGWRRFTRFAKYFAISGVACFGLAVFLNICWVLPFRRQLELEADYCGLKFAAKACFKLQSIASHWDTLNFAGAVPEWRSTHPTAMTRKALILSLIPWAEGVRASNGCSK